MLGGPSVELYEEIVDKTRVHLIASGGITTMDDILLLQQIGCEGAIIGKAIYEGRIKLKDLSGFILNNQNNVPRTHVKRNKLSGFF